MREAPRIVFSASMLWSNHIDKLHVLLASNEMSLTVSLRLSRAKIHRARMEAECTTVIVLVSKQRSVSFVWSSIFCRAYKKL